MRCASYLRLMPMLTPGSPDVVQQPLTGVEPAEYVLGTDEAEAIRLGLQHRLWSASAYLLWERAGLRTGMRVIDVGCGPGHAALDMADIVGPTGSVVGLDESPVFLTHLHQRSIARRLTNIERVLGDVQDIGSLGMPDGEFDFAYARWVLCFVRDPQAVVAGVSRLLKPGGRFVIQDYFNYESMTLAPRRPSFVRVIQAIAAAWRARGGDPDVAARVPEMFARHGIELTHLAVNNRAARPTDTMWAWPDTFWRTFVPKLEASGFLSPQDRAAFEADWADATADEVSFIHLPPVYDIIGQRR